MNKLELLNKKYIKNYFFKEVKTLFIIRGEPYLNYSKILAIRRAERWPYSTYDQKFFLIRSEQLVEVKIW